MGIIVLFNMRFGKKNRRHRQLMHNLLNFNINHVWLETEHSSKSRKQHIYKNSSQSLDLVIFEVI